MFLHSTVSFHSISALLSLPSNFLFFSCLERCNCTRGLIFWSVWLIFPSSKCTELQPESVCVKPKPYCPISYLSSLKQWLFFPPPSPHLFFCPFTLSVSLSLLTFLLSSRYLLVPSHPPFPLSLFFLLPQTLAHTYTKTHTRWKHFREANTNRCQLVTVGCELEYKCSSLSE